MFDIGFWELSVIMVVALLVVGPERLPKLARTVGMWLGRARRFVSTVKDDIDRELATEELKKSLARQTEIPELSDTLKEAQKILKADIAPTQPAPDDKIGNKTDATTGKLNKTQDES